MSLNPFRLVSCPLGTTSSSVVKGVVGEEHGQRMDKKNMQRKRIPPHTTTAIKAKPPSPPQLLCKCFKSWQAADWKNSQSARQPFHLNLLGWAGLYCGCEFVLRPSWKVSEIHFMTK
jgi:hypothetical protein